MTTLGFAKVSNIFVDNKPDKKTAILKKSLFDLKY